MKIIARFVTLAVVQMDGVQMEHRGLSSEHRGFSPGERSPGLKARGSKPSKMVGCDD